MKDTVAQYLGTTQEVEQAVEMAIVSLFQCRRIVLTAGALGREICLWATSIPTAIFCVYKLYLTRKRPIHLLR
jgi:hypothetical protein